MGILKYRVPARMCTVEYRRGQFRGVRQSGTYWRRPGTQRVQVDLRQSVVTVPVQEIAVADGIVVRMSAAIRYAVVDARAFVEYADDPIGELYLATQVAMRDALSDASVEQIAGRNAVSAGQLSEAISAAAAAIGVEARVVIKDVVLPGRMRDAAMDVLTAKQRGLAKLEEARAETAALRSLANAAKLLDDHPAVAKLRMIEAVPQSATVVVKLDD
ncbi:slipin family protein [Epidermidibacterium keratini]|uniref:Slipin family protein n=1 Tax=Epidermidibacterium keratini TaxID=1891644 RepID=A0A7L4YR00_9ACTN|nr:slipin family protein [Epidermidibacterium keratini]QHC00987.1 slipin family protein [Epidermidibacterium keratini]